jgi:diketogulonate reductase-like aldo/keto reductase
MGPEEPAMWNRRRALRTLAAAGAYAVVRPSTALAQPRAILSRAIPSTGEPLPAIGLGSWITFNVGDDRAARDSCAEVMGAFFREGGRLIDSSPMYGSSESVTGQLVAELGVRAKLFVATKVWTSGRQPGVRQMDDSMRKLRVERLDLMQVHNLVDADVQLSTLSDWKASGRVRYTGVTHYQASAHGELEKFVKRRDMDFVQVNYSLAEPEADRRLLRAAADSGAAVIVNRPFAEGAMFQRVKGKAVPEWAKEIGCASWAQFFLKWILGQPAVTCVIPATRNPAHVADNLAAAVGPPPDEAMRRKMADFFRSL